MGGGASLEGEGWVEGLGPREIVRLQVNFI